MGEGKGAAEEGSVGERAGPIEMHNVSLREIKTDPLAHELATSEGMQPYLDRLINGTAITPWDSKPH
jgi:hypothetical protein